MSEQVTPPPQDVSPEISRSSRFNLKLMWNINKLSIAIFVIAVIWKIIDFMTRD